jgi:acyl-CoA hydrolase
MDFCPVSTKCPFSEPKFYFIHCARHRSGQDLNRSPGADGTIGHCGGSTMTELIAQTITSENLTEIRLYEMVFPDISNHYGTLFAGCALSLMVKAAFIAATRYSKGPVVLRASRQTEIFRPVPVGHLLELNAFVSDAGRTSMTIDVIGRTDDLASGGNVEAMRGHFTMVAVDDEGKATPIAARMA